MESIYLVFLFVLLSQKESDLKKKQVARIFTFPERTYQGYEPCVLNVIYNAEHEESSC